MMKMILIRKQLRFQYEFNGYVLTVCQDIVGNVDEDGGGKRPERFAWATFPQGKRSGRSRVRIGKCALFLAADCHQRLRNKVLRAAAAAPRSMLMSLKRGRSGTSRKSGNSSFMRLQSAKSKALGV